MLTDELRPYLDRLRELAFVRDLRLVGADAPEVDAVLELDTPTRKQVRLHVELKRSHLTNEVAEGLFRLTKKRGAKLIVFAPHVGRDLAERLTRDRINFVDRAGNCHVDIDDRYIAHIEGRRPESKGAMTRGLRAPAYQVMFALLAKPELARATARTLAAAAGNVSPQTAIDARVTLLERGFLVGSRRLPKWAPGGWRATLDLFISGFSATLRPSLVVGRFRAKERTVEHLEMELGPRLNRVAKWRWGSGAAAHRVTGYFRGDSTLVYVERPAPAAKDIGLLPDSAGSVTLLASPGPLFFKGARPDTVHPLLIYADLLVEGDERSREAAAQIYHRYLAELEAAAA